MIDTTELIYILDVTKKRPLIRKQRSYVLLI